MKKGSAWKVAILCSLACGSAWAASCEQPQDAVAIRTAALQQEMMVAAFVCRDVEAYNSFVISHQGELQDSDKNLMGFFQQLNARTGFDDYNYYKTELANASSLRSIHDPQFCLRINSDFRAVLGKSESLPQLLQELPYPVDTGAVYCPYAGHPPPVTMMAGTTPRAHLHHRTWLGRLIDSVF